jgi:D-alanine-D-alanine ligase
MDDGYDNFNAEYYLQNYSSVKIVMEPPIRKTIQSINRDNEFDVYLNLCEGYQGWYYTGIEVVKTLEELNLPFTGADSRFYNPTREEMQASGEAVGVGFVAGVNVSDVGEVDAIADELRFPMIVKHPNSYGSTGMTRKSRVEDVKQLKQQVRRICKNYGSARIEEFIDGREFTTFIVDNPDGLGDPFVYPPAEVTFPPGETFLFAHVKWKKYVYLKKVDDERLASRLMRMTGRLYKALHGVGYARCDFRMNKQGELFMLEINPNNGILYEPKDIGHADIMMEYDPDGHEGFLDRIFRSALMRHQNKISE